MLLQEKLQNIFIINALVFVGLLLMVSIGLAQSGAWNPKADIPTARILASSCELNGKIYVIGGGKTAYSSLNVMEVYDPVTDTWDTTKTPMPTARAELCVAAVNGKIYAIGGATAHMGSPLGMVEEYDPQTDTWDTNKQPMPTARMGAACGVFNNKIYIAGGSTTGRPNWAISKKLEIYDPVTDNWTSGDNMPTAIYYPQGAVLNDTFYLIGGLIGPPWAGQRIVQKYDLTTNTWAPGTNLIHGRVGHTADVVNYKIYVIGGDGQPPIRENVEEYNPQTGIWAVIDTIPSPMIMHTSSVYGNEIYVFSGSIRTLMELILTNNVYSFTSIVSIASQKNLTPDVFILHQNYPNPFNPATTIEFSIPNSEYVTLKIFNQLGQEVTTLVSEKLIAGKYQYTWDAGSLASGVYLYSLTTSSGFSQSKKLVLLK